MLIDYHLHNRFSPDSDEDTRDILRALSNMGIKEACLTNHNEWFDNENIMGLFKLEEALSRFEAAKKDLEEARADFPEMSVKFGTELTFEADQTKDLDEFVEKMDFDFVLSSVHHVNGHVVSSHMNLEAYFGRQSEKEAYTPYFEQLLEMVQWGNFDAVAHFDVVKKYGHLFYGPFRPEKYEKLIREILKTMKKNGIGLELNVRSLHSRCQELFPHPDILKWALEEGVEHFTLGSDAHHLEDVGLYVKEGVEIARQTGIQSVSTYTKRNPGKHSIS